MPKQRQNLPENVASVPVNDRVKDLKRKRDILSSRLNRFEAFVSLFQQSPSCAKLIELDSRLKDAESNLLKEYNDVQFQLEGIDFESFQEDFENSFETNYYRIISLAKEQMFNCQGSNAFNNSSKLNSGSQKSLNIKFPVIELPKFSGAYERWLEFKDTFISLVHNSEHLDPVQKFHYLKASLEGQASQCIQCVDITSENYGLAWDMLCQRFDNKRLIVHNHIKSLFNVPEMKHESPLSFRNLVDLISKNIRSLESIGIKTENWDPLIIYLVTSKFDPDTIREWEQYVANDDFPLISQLKTFLLARADFLYKISLHKPRLTNTFKPKNQVTNRFSGNTTTNNSQSKGKHLTFSCYLCGKPHSIYKCEQFIALPPTERKEKVKNLRLCLNCLQKGHDASQCKYGSCRHCDEKHNSLLHHFSSTALNSSVLKEGQSSVTSKPLVSESIKLTDDNSHTTTCNASFEGHVLLATALVEVLDTHGQRHVCRALLDSGSMSNFISSNLVTKLNLPQDSVDVSISGIDEATTHVSKSCDIQIKSLNSNFKTIMHCLVISNITSNLPAVSVNPALIEVPSNIQLADPKYYESNTIDILVGAAIFWKLLSKGKKHLGANLPVLQNSKLGWYISGPVTCDKPQRKIFSHLSTNAEIQSSLTKFWKLEEVSPVKSLSSEDQKAEDHFQKTFRRDSNGRFIVSIPLKESISKLGETKPGALRQFLALEKRLSSNPKLREMYTDFLQEYDDLNHMSSFQPSPNDVCFFSPHHGVLREESSTTKLRVVFNGSFASTTGWSYNALQMVGPTVQEDLLSILLRFRQHSYVISADICKMYRQIRVDDAFKPLQLILWRSSPEQEMQTYALSTVVYGTASAPFLATRCLLQLSIESQDSFPQASEVIKRDFYVDDLLSGGRSIDEVVTICNQVSSILKGAGFELRKWKSNDSSILDKLKLSIHSEDKFYFNQSKTSKTLGMLWSSQEDDLSFSIELSNLPKRLTKRFVLSETAKIFDPLGLLGPVIIVAKIFLQTLWSENLSWDEELPSDLTKRWLAFRAELPELNACQISRQATCKNFVKIELHGFSDASQHAYGACIYLRCVDINQRVHVHLLASKTRVAPLKSVSIPRLELCAAYLLAQLYSKIKSSLSVAINGVHFWCDSTVALAWIRSSSSNFQVFVANRVAEIQTLAAPELWRYVPTAQNPADLVSRGVSPKTFVTLKEWFYGPLWLHQLPSEWPNDITMSNPISIPDLPEARKNVFALVQTENLDHDLFPYKRFSSFSRIKRVMAYCLRFINNCKTPKLERITQDLTLEELKVATTRLVMLVQRESFSNDLSSLIRQGFVDNKSSLSSLTPIMIDGIMRVGGRLRHSAYPLQKRHPVLLPAKHYFCYLIFKYEHFNRFHCGPQLLLSIVRECYWPIAGRNLAKKVVRECVVCFRFKPKFINPLMGHLPESRVSASPPFSNVGVDYAGPFYYRDHKGRGGKALKCYLCLFICLSVKAVHLELVTELSTAKFLEAFQRFISRRGKPSTVHSDNGSNFVGANNQLKELGNFLKSNKNVIIRQLGNDLNIKWHFISAYSPHHGGIWEAAIKSAKRHLLRALTSSITTLTFESFYTVVTQVENILNSRPLTPLSTDPNDLCALTPSHFLIGRTSESLPNTDLTSTPTNRLDYFERLEKIKQHFWERWAREYVTTLQQRHKWKVHQPNLSVGDLVVVRDDNIPPFKWRLGRITEVHPGSDGIVRVASVKTSSGVIKRTVVKLAPLPLD